jgi:hypothetical protein
VFIVTKGGEPPHTSYLNYEIFMENPSPSGFSPVSGKKEYFFFHGCAETICSRDSHTGADGPGPF